MIFKTSRIFFLLSDDVAGGQAGESKAFYFAISKKLCFKNK